MHLKCKGDSGFWNIVNSETKILELNGTQENPIKEFKIFDEIETVVLH